jgi:hypothetical protein
LLLRIAPSLSPAHWKAARRSQLDLRRVWRRGSTLKLSQAERTPLGRRYMTPSFIGYFRNAAAYSCPFDGPEWLRRLISRRIRSSRLPYPRSSGHPASASPVRRRQAIARRAAQGSGRNPRPDMERFQKPSCFADICRHKTCRNDVLICHVGKTADTYKTIANIDYIGVLCHSLYLTTNGLQNRCSTTELNWPRRREL